MRVDVCARAPRIAIRLRAIATAIGPLNRPAWPHGQAGLFAFPRCPLPNVGPPSPLSDDDIPAAIAAIRECGSAAEAAEKLGLSPDQLKRAFARRGLPSPGTYARNSQAQLEGMLPPGHMLKGVSTYVDRHGEVRGQWVKTNVDHELRMQALLGAVERIAEPFRGTSEAAPKPEATRDDLLTVYPMGDPHLGMYAWAEESGDDFDLELAERHLVAAVDHLVNLAPASKTALIANLGDFFHSDNNSNRTARSGHSLDVDTRWAKVAMVGTRVMRRIIDRSQEKHELTRVVCEIGNHDDHSAQMLALCLAQFYENNPRVEIDTSPAKFHWLRFGANLIGITHGDTVKADKLPGVMACDRAKDWGETKHRYFYTGHVHHDSLKEYPGVVVETFRTLAAKDAWHAAQGYRSGRDMKCDVLHRDYGRITRHVVGIEQVMP